MASLSIPILSKLSESHRVILASGSPRRKELFDRLDLTYEVIPSNFAEDLDKSQFATAGDYVLENSVLKAQDVYMRLKGDSPKPLLIIGSDTVVVSSEGKILEKPASAEDAIATLKSLSSKTNTVFTGVCLVVDVPGESEPRIEKAIESTEVVFGTLDDALVEAYVATGEPMDKAGSYAYQSLACFFVKEIRGDFYNVVGFPCARFYQMLLGLHRQGAF
ncbi:acetylserotonin O-methyltransferase-like protein [Martensiomyces pterosporus]|nr:acetylserotonin O-methyltransferase-like protein [Martensiomyces pterosporus]